MEHSDKAKFILALHKHSLKAFADGGTALGGPDSGGASPNAVNPNHGLIGTVNGALGLNNDFSAGAAQIQAGTNAAQLNSAYNGVQGALGNQQDFMNRAKAQNGFGNQANVFSQQQALADQLGAQSRGEGPDPAQAALAQNTASNVANQSAMMAGQRGAGANVGLMARQAAMQGAQTQQQSVGQAATMKAQQQIAAQSALANQQAQMQGVAGNQIAAEGQSTNNFSSAQQNEQNILQNANTAFNNASVAQQANINNVNAQTAASNQNMAGNTVGALANFASNGSSMLGGMGGARGGMVHKYAEGGDVGDFQPTSGENSNGPDVPSTATNPVSSSNPLKVDQGKGGGGGGGGAGGLMQMLPMLAMAAADGGIVPPPLMSAGGGGPQSFAGQWLNSTMGSSSGPSIGATASNPGFVDAKWGKKDPNQKAAAPKADKLGKPEESLGDNIGDTSSIVPSDVMMSATGGPVKSKNSKEKAVKKDNSYSNDKIPALLSEGEIVLPRSVTMHPKAPEKAAEFVMAVLRKKGMKKK